MEMVILILKIYMFFVIFIMTIYTLRHFRFTVNRVLGEQRVYYHDIIDSELPTVSILIPMHNEEKVARGVLDLLIQTSYPREKLEIIPIDDHSEDNTKEILTEYAGKYSYIKPFIRDSGKRGKPSALNDVIEIATGEVIVVFDADYLPPRGIVRDIAISFKDPEVAAVMGRVIPINIEGHFLTRLLDLERTGGYQVDQQARHNLKLLPQYGGTVGAFRRNLVIALGGFNPNILTEDTELTFKLFSHGWKVVYANKAECYEEAPETWNVRARQVSRWARGHTQVMFLYLIPLLKSKYLNLSEKIDGILLLGVYIVPFILLTGIFDSLALFFLGEMNILDNIFVFAFVALYNSSGNSAPFYQIATGAFLDGATNRIRLLPMLMFNFMFYLWYISKGSMQALVDVITKRATVWQKTERYRKQEDTQ